MLALILVATVLGLMFWCGQVTAKFAVQRGRSKRSWFLVGAILFLFFPLPSIVLALLPPHRVNAAI